MSLTIQGKPRPFVTLIAIVIVGVLTGFAIKNLGYFWVMVIPNIFLLILTIVLLVAYFHIGEKEKVYPKIYPMLSVVIPAFNVKDTIAKTLESIKRSDYPGKMEIIIVDDGSTDGTRELLPKLEGVRVLLKEKNAGKAAALNSAFKVVKGEIVACVDSDSYPEPAAFREAVASLLSDEKSGAVTCFIRVFKPDNLLRKIQDIEYLTGFGFSQITTKSIGAIFVTPGPTTIFRREVLEKIEGFDEHNITEDLEMAWRLRKHGYEIEHSAESVVYTEVPGDLKTLYRQRMRWYRGKLFNIRKHSDMLFNPKYGNFGLFILPFSFTAEFAGTILSFSFLWLVFLQLSWTLRYIWSNFTLGAPLLDISSILVVGMSTMIVGLVLVSPWFLTVYLSHVVGKKKVELGDLPAIVLFLMFYGTVISVFYCISLFKEINRSDYRWK